MVSRSHDFSVFLLSSWTWTSCFWFLQIIPQQFDAMELLNLHRGHFFLHVSGGKLWNEAVLHQTFRFLHFSIHLVQFLCLENQF
jgi:hypothetical protein